MPRTSLDNVDIAPVWADLKERLRGKIWDCVPREVFGSPPSKPLKDKSMYLCRMDVHIDPYYLCKGSTENLKRWGDFVVGFFNVDTRPVNLRIQQIEHDDPYLGFGFTHRARLQPGEFRFALHGRYPLLTVPLQYRRPDLVIEPRDARVDILFGYVLDMANRCSLASRPYWCRSGDDPKDLYTVCETAMLGRRKTLPAGEGAYELPDLTCTTESWGVAA